MKDVNSSSRMSAEDRKTAIIKAALPVFAEKGFDGATTRDIAAAAGVSEALLYRHFPGKEALYTAMQHLCCQEKTESMLLLHQSEPSTATLIRIITTLITSIVKGDNNPYRPMLKRIMVQSLMTDGNFARTFYQAYIEPNLPLIERCLEAAEKAGDMVPVPVTNRHKLLFAHHLAVALSLFMLPEKPVVEYGSTPEERIKEAAWYALRGMGLKDQVLKKYLDQ